MNIFPGRIVDSVNGMVGKVKIAVLRAVTLVGHTMSFFDQDGNILDTVDIGINNVEGLNEALESKINQIDVVDTNTNTPIHKIAQIGSVDINETVTKLNPTELQGTTLPIRLVNENGIEQVVSVNLGGLVTNESGITNAEYNASTNIITLTEVDGDIWEINLGEFSIIINTDSNGVTTLTQEGVVKATLSRVGQTGQFSHILNLPTTIEGYGITDVYTKTQSDERFAPESHGHSATEITEDEDHQFVTVGEKEDWNNKQDKITTDESLYLDPETNQLRANVSTYSETFIKTGEEQTWEMAFEPTYITDVDGKVPLKDRHWQWTPPKSFKVLVEMDPNEEVKVTYEHFPE